MKQIKEITEHIEDELKDAECYVRNATEIKTQFPEIAELYMKLSEERMSAVIRLHDAAAAAIKKWRTTNGEPPADMQAVYDFLHKRHIDKAAEIRILQGLFRQ